MRRDLEDHQYTSVETTEDSLKRNRQPQCQESSLENSNPSFQTQIEDVASEMQ